MITKLYNSVCSTDSLPIIGGASGAVIQAHNIFPTWETIIYTIVVAAVGAAVGYVVKLFLDYIVRSYNQ